MIPSLISCGGSAVRETATTPPPQNVQTDNLGRVTYHQCLEIAYQDIEPHMRQFFGDAEGEINEGDDGLNPSWIPDVDGDGIEELDFEAGVAWNYSWPHFLYLSRGCVFGGAFLDGELEVLESTVNGHRVLESSTSEGCTGGNRSYRQYEWRDDMYKVADQWNCSLCEWAQSLEDDGPLPPLPPGTDERCLNDEHTGLRY